MNALFLAHLQQRLSELLHTDLIITEGRQVYGGDINTTYILAAGSQQYFVKCNDLAAPDLFQKEYNGLQLLKNKSRLHTPAPVVYGVFGTTSYLVMECLVPSSFTVDTWQALGEGLAGMHKLTQTQFGLYEDNYIGSLSQPNHLSGTWAAFYAEQRILPLIKTAFDNGLCRKEDVTDAEAVSSKLSALFPEEPPALLHGDLWSGNVMACANGKATIYDPAVYYGHREMDIAMTLLFGGFDASFYHHYESVYPLQNGWQQRVALCQLYPLLVHLNLFGEVYYGRVRNVLHKIQVTITLSIKEIKSLLFIAGLHSV